MPLPAIGIGSAAGAAGSAAAGGGNPLEPNTADSFIRSWQHVRWE